MKFLLTFFSFLFLFISFLFPYSASAASNFSTDYNVIYTINDEGVTNAAVNVVLTNTSTQFFASSYKMQIGFDDITNVRARDSGGAITPKITKNDIGYIIELNFNKKAVGLGAKQQFTLTFDTAKLARHYGRILEIDIPGISNPDDFSNFVVELKVPTSFGEASYIKPAQPNKSLVFSKETLGKSGISLAFGKKQLYKYRLLYHLRNPNLYPITTEIALPSNTNYQQVAVNSLNPKPLNVVLDKDGNWLAQYRLTSAQSSTVIAEGTVEVSLAPSKVEITETEKAVYTKEAKYWETSNDKIRELADELKTPEAIYHYVVNTLKYDFKRVTEEKPRLGAVKALQNPSSAVCREYTDLFIALARAAGIPAREVDGFAYTENAKQRPLSLEKDILHVWPEYYDTEKKTWVMVDPTWGSTTGGVDYFDVNDFSHVAFVRKGVNSEYPLPAGAYKYEANKNQKDVHIEFTLEPEKPQGVIESETKMPDKVIAGIPITGEIIVHNNTSTFLTPQLVYLTSKTLQPNTQTIATAGIPPYGNATVPFKYQPTSFLTNTEGDYTILVAGASNTFRVNSAPFFMTPVGGGISIGIFAFIILIITFRGRRLRLSRRGR